VRIWGPATGQKRAVLEGDTDWLRSVCALSLGSKTLLAAAGDDGTARIWDPGTGQQRAALQGHTGGIYGLCSLTLRGQVLLATASDDGSARIWDPATGRCLLTVPVHHAALAVCQAPGSLVIGLRAGVLAVELNPAFG